MRAHLHEGAREIAEGIYHTVRTFAAGERQRDDITSVIMVVSEAASPQVPLIAPTTSHTEALVVAG